ncbi:MAG TPA: hypothetical protein VM737_12605, partial [Gemmatimonadota bacterium]|nr:hypothetical protein [Gemmatimonadota bacterium]
DGDGRETGGGSMTHTTLSAYVMAAGLMIGMATTLPAQEAPARVDGPAVVRIEIEPDTVRATVGDTVRLRATAYGAEGVVVDAPILWLTSYEIGTIDSTGAFVAHQDGENQIIASSGDVTASVAVLVDPLPPSRIEIRIPATSVAATSWLPLGAAAFNRIDRQVFDAAFDWSSSDPSVAEIISGFLVTKGSGRVELTARSGGSSTAQTVTITAAPTGALAMVSPEASIRTGDVFQLAPTLAGQALPAGSFPRFTVTGPAGRVWPDGAFVAAEPGRYVVVADFAGSSATAEIEVEPRTHDREFELVGHMGVPNAHTADIWVFDDATYLGTFGDNSLRVYDVSDPAQPVLTDSVTVDARRINDVMANPDRGFAIMTREGAADRVNGIVILDIDDPLHPEIAGEYTETVSGGVHTTWIVGDLVYATHNGTGDMRIIDVSDAANPREVGRWGIDSPNRVLHDIFIKDGIAYLSHWDDGLVILDLGGAGKGGTPTEPVFVSRVYYPEGNTHMSWRWRNYVFVGDEIFPPNWSMDRPIDARGYIHVFDVSDLENPVEVATFEVPEAGTHNFWIDDDEEVLYIAYYQAGLRALDVSGELRGDLYAQGRQIDYYMTEAPEGVVLPNATFSGTVMTDDGLIYTVDFNSGLWVHRLVPAGDRPIS